MTALGSTEEHWFALLNRTQPPLAVVTDGLRCYAGSSHKRFSGLGALNHDKDAWANCDCYACAPLLL
jgi:hypothetical protein